MIEFVSITIEGFGSFLKPFSYVLGGPGVHIIGGKNGGGKTTIFSALVWCLYDRPLKSKDITPWKVPKDFKGTKVEVNFNKNENHYKVIRKKTREKRNELYLYKDGAYVQDLRDKKDVQKAIEEILGVSFNLFKNSIVFGQNLTRLMRETGPKQKEVFDEAFEVTYINEARIKASKSLLDIKKDCDKFISKIDNLKTSIHDKKRTLEAYEEQKQTIQENLQEVEKDLSEIYKKLKKAKAQKALQKEKAQKIKETKALVEKLEILEGKYFKLDFTHEQEKAETEGLRQRYKKMAELSTKRIPVCPTCGQTIKDTQDRKRNQKQELKKLRSEILARSLEDKERAQKLLKLDSSIKKLSKHRIEYNSLTKSLQKNNNQLLIEYKAARLKLRERSERYQEDLKAVGIKKSFLEIEIAGYKEDLKQVESEYQKTERNLKLHTWLINDPLSNKGLKAFIFNAMLDSINGRLAYYGSFTGNVVSFSVDLDSGNKNFEASITEGTLIKPYESMSGGEQQLIDICLAFSIHDVMTQNHNFNILLMDEIFESLDADNIELVSELVSLKARNTAVHIITHQQSMVFNQVVSQVTLKKTKKGTVAV